MVEELTTTVQIPLYLLFTPDRRQSKMLITIEECGSKVARNSVFDCHLSPVGRQMAIENLFMIFDLRLWIVLTFSIAAYPVCYCSAR